MWLYVCISFNLWWWWRWWWFFSNSCKMMFKTSCLSPASWSFHSSCCRCCWRSSSTASAAVPTPSQKRWSHVQTCQQLVILYFFFIIGTRIEYISHKVKSITLQYFWKKERATRIRSWITTTLYFFSHPVQKQDALFHHSWHSSGWQGLSLSNILQILAKLTIQMTRHVYSFSYACNHRFRNYIQKYVCPSTD